MTIGDNYNITLTIENFCPNNLTVTPSLVHADDSLSVTFYQSAITSFNSKANSTMTYVFNVKALKMT